MSAFETAEIVIAPTELELASELLASLYDIVARLGALGADADIVKSDFIKLLILFCKDLIEAYSGTKYSPSSGNFAMAESQKATAG